MVKKRILVFSAYYIPGYKGGGPIRSLENIFNQLSEGVDFYLVTLNRDLGDNKPYKGINTNTWTTVGKVSVFYIDRNYNRLKYLLSYKIVYQQKYNFLCQIK